jgi:hypothetical protein
MIVSAKGCWNSAAGVHKIYFDQVVGANLAAYGPSLPAHLLQFLRDNHSLLRDGDEEDFRSIQNEYETLLPLCMNFDWLNGILQKIYDYAKFAEKKKRKWCAYGLCRRTNVKTCPYCNLSYELTIFDQDEGVMRPALDHFFDKSKYPLFGISIGNLVPSCHHCNSTLKGSKDFVRNEHLNPLESDESIKIILDVDLIGARYDLRVVESARVKLQYDNTSMRVTNSISTFYLQLRYDSLVEEVRTAAIHMINYSLSGSPDPLHRNWVLNGVSSANYRNKIMGKMFMDLASEFLH